MKPSLRYTLFCIYIIFASFWQPLEAKQSKKDLITISVPQSSGVRVNFGAQQLARTLSSVNYKVVIINDKKRNSSKKRFIIVNEKREGVKESFSIESDINGNIIIEGGDDSGILYAFTQLAEIVEDKGELPLNINIKDQPEMVLRGTAIGVQKPDYLPGRDVYEYPYTEESFPWFYDKKHWIDYLDMMLENRYNSLYLWNGHPFSSLVKLKDYPYALEVDEATFKKNEEVFKFLTEEADKRGIWVIQMFYNILLPEPFAHKHGLKTQDRNVKITPLISDYTRKSIAAFVEKYPNVGLLVTLGEAMEGVGQDDIEWFTKTIIPGVQDGLKAINSTQEPPIVLRAHDTDAPAVMKASLPLYKNLYTMAKYNGEALTTYETRGKWADLHKSLSRIGTVHIQNVHILANLEPFRYGSPDFIQKSVQAMHDIHESNGLHLYPQSSYWDWPYTADKGPNRTMQIDRDWMWYKAWARYAWKVKRDKKEEEAYWAKQLSKQFGAEDDKTKHIVEAYEAAGEISPKILRRFGITDGNRQTSTLGMLMTQFINPFRYGVFTLMYESEAPEGEMIIDYAEKQWKQQPHIGETPMQIANEILVHGKNAVEAINKAAPFIKKDVEEFNRLKNDMYIHNEMAKFYSDKVKAAIQVLRFKYSNDVADLEKALPLLESSVLHYKELVKLTEDTYLYANSMQTKQRKIPMRGVDKTFIHWKEMLPVYEVEIANFKNSIDSLKNNTSKAGQTVKAYQNVDVKVLNKNVKRYLVKEGSKPFLDKEAVIKAVAPELNGLNGIAFNAADQEKEGSTLTFKAEKAVTVLVAFFNDKSNEYSPTPVLEIDASANNYGQAESKISKGVMLAEMPLLNVHAYSFPAGTNTLTLAKGKILVLGFVDAKQNIKIYDAALDGSSKDIDWLFGHYAPTDVKL
jgi:hypothetical protein